MQPIDENQSVGFVLRDRCRQSAIRSCLSHLDEMPEARPIQLMLSDRPPARWWRSALERVNCHVLARVTLLTTTVALERISMALRYEEGLQGG